MTTVTIFGGVREIGGNKILVADRDGSVFLDFGKSFKTEGQYFDEFLRPRAPRGLTDYLELGLLPPVGGLYRTDLEPPGHDLWERLASLGRMHAIDRDRLRGVILSHAHLDHSGYIAFLNAEIPIFCSAVTAFLAKGIQDTGRGTADEEVVYTKERVPYEPEKNPIEVAVNEARRAAGLGLLKASPTKQPAEMRPFYLTDDPGGADAGTFWRDTPETRPLDARPWQPASAVWGSALRVFPVDHSIPGACALILETEAGPLAYTGDLRRQGHGAQQTEAFVNTVAALEEVTLLCEGTRIRGESGTAATPVAGAPAPTEAEVAANCLEAVRRAEGRLVIADFGPRNIERLHNFLHIAEETRRLLVILDKDAYVLRALGAAGYPEAPPPDHPRVRIFLEPTTTPGVWRRDHIWRPLQDRLISAKDIREAPGDYLVCFSLFQLNDLVDLRPDGGIYIYSTSEPYSDEQRFDLERLRNWLHHFGMTLVGDPEVAGEARFHASGHAPEADLRWVVETINPKRLIPIHTQHPEWFAEQFGDRMEVIQPEVGTPIPLE